MNLDVIFDAIVPDNIKNIPLVQKSLGIFIKSLNRNALVSQRILKLYTIDDETWYTIDESGEQQIVKDSEFLKKSKDNLKKGLLMTYLGVLYDLVSKAQLNNNIREATNLRNYQSSLIFKEQHDILTSEFLGSFRSVQQAIGTENSIHYIYQFARYLETGYLSDDLDLNSKESSNFVMNYNGQLHKYYFIEFMHHLAHPVGWAYTYTTMLEFILQDYYGIEFKYELPRIVIKKNNKYIFFTNLTKSEFLESLKTAISSDETRYSTIWQEQALYYDVDPLNSRSITYKDIENFNFYETNDLDTSKLDELFSEYDVILVHYTYLRYDFYYANSSYKNSLVSFTNGKCIWFDNKNVYFGTLESSYDYEPKVDNFYKFDPFWDLDCGSVTEISNRTTYKILYTDDAEFSINIEPTYGNFSYLEPHFENVFKLVGKKFIYTQGYDESKVNVLINNNQDAIREFDDSFNVSLSFYNHLETYIDIQNSLGQRYRNVFSKIGYNNVILNSSHWADELTIRALTVDSDVYIKTNLLLVQEQKTKITNWKYNDNSQTLVIEGITDKNTVDIKLNGVVHKAHVSANKFSCSVIIDDKLTIELEKLYIETNLFEKDYYNTELQFPIISEFKNPDVQISKIQSTTEMYSYSSGKTFNDLNDLSSFKFDLESSDNTNLNNYIDTRDSKFECLITKGFKEQYTDTSEQIVMTSPKFVRDDIKFDFGGDYYLIFNNESDGCDFIDYEDAESKGFISNGNEKSFLFTVESNKFPETIDRASWLRINHFITCKR